MKCKFWRVSCDSCYSFEKLVVVFSKIQPDLYMQLLVWIFCWQVVAAIPASACRGGLASPVTTWRFFHP